MEKVKDILKKSWPIGVAVLLFGLVSIIGFAPQLEGKVLVQGDIQQFNGMSRDIRECREQFGEDPQWTGAMFSGMPAYQINIKYPSQIIKRTVDAVQSFFAEPASMVFFAMLAAFVMVIMMGMSAWVGIIVGLAYGLSTYFFLIIGAGHITKMWAAVYAPAMLGAIHYTLRKNMWLGGALTALFATLEVGANHPQITYYFVFAAASLFISEVVYAVKEKRLGDIAKRAAVLLGAAVLALGANFAPLYYTMQHTDDTTRGGSAVATNDVDSKGLDLRYATAWSYGITESGNLLIPNLMGGDSGNTFAAGGELAKEFQKLGADKRTAEMYAQQVPTYWGEQPYTAGPTYLGAIVIFLALLGLLLAENRDRWWILAVSVLALFMAWGYHTMWFTEFCFKHIPLYNKFRAVSTALVVIQWSAPLLAGIGLWQLYKNWDEKKRLIRAIATSVAVVGGICIIFALGGSALFDFDREQSIAMMGKAVGDEGLGYALGEAMVAERASMLADDATRSFIFVALAAGVLIIALNRKQTGKWTPAVVASILAVLVVADILPVNLRYVPYERFVPKRQSKIMPTKANKEIMADKELGYRVLNDAVSTFNDATTSMFHRSIGGYHGAKMGRYQDVIDSYLNQDNDGTFAVIDMLNTKYIILSKDEYIENPTRNGAAWFVESVEQKSTPKEALEALGKVNLKTTAVVEGEVPQIESTGKGTISLVEYRPNYLRYDYSLEGGSAVAVFSEIYYDKGWQAYIDGKEAESFRADYLLRAMVLPEGTHSVEWRFKAPNWNLISTITLICSILIIFALVTSLIYKYYGCTKKHIA
jgi:hypothetical protein